MSRPPLDPSGTAVTLTIRLSPRHLGIVDGIAAVHGATRTAVIRSLIDGAGPFLIDDVRSLTIDVGPLSIDWDDN